jgi:hypothetical protein
VTEPGRHRGDGDTQSEDRRGSELEDRTSGIEAIVKASATAEPAQVTSGGVHEPGLLVRPVSWDRPRFLMMPSG